MKIIKNLLSVHFLFISIVFSPFVLTEISDTQMSLLDNLPPDQRESVLMKMRQADELGEELEETFEKIKTFTDRPERKTLSEEEMIEHEKKSRNWVFGYEQFQSSPTTFAPASNVPVPPNFTLGPGDKLSIEYFGNDEAKEMAYISRAGTFNLPLIGPVVLTGLTFSEAKTLIKEKVSSKLIGTEVFISLTETRSVTVYVLGEAYKPGAYTVSSLSTITNLLFVSGGVNENGSLRKIKLRRKGEKDLNFDLYELLLRGNTESDIRLLDGDVLFIPIIEKTARAEGSFRRPHLYEIHETDTINDLIFFAGGFKAEASEFARLELSRINSQLKKREVSNFSSEDKPLLSQSLKDGDSLKVFEYSSLEPAQAEIYGQVKYPGTYTILPGDSLLTIIERAGGLNEVAYPHGAVFLREEVAKQQKVYFEQSADFLEEAIASAITGGDISEVSADAFKPISVLISRLRNTKPVGRLIVETDPLVLRKDPQTNFLLEDGDKIFFPKRPSSVNVVGEVYTPSSHSFKSGRSLQDYINNSGGVRNTADKKSIFIIGPDGSSIPIKKGLFSQSINSILPGSTIVIPRSSRPFDWLVLSRSITPIFANLATSAAAIAVLDRN